MHFRITSSFQRYILIFKWKALHYNSYNNFFSFTFFLYFAFQFLLHYLSVPTQANQEGDRQSVRLREREREKEKDWIKWEVKELWRILHMVQREVPGPPVAGCPSQTRSETSGFFLLPNPKTTKLSLAYFCRKSGGNFSTSCLRDAVPLWLGILFGEPRLCVAAPVPMGSGSDKGTYRHLWERNTPLGSPGSWTPNRWPFSLALV